MKKLLPAILALLGLAAGTGAGIFLKPPVETNDDEKVNGSQNSAEMHTKEDGKDIKSSPEDLKKPVRRSELEEENLEPENSAYEYVKLNNQFIVPVVTGSKISALVVMSLSIEVKVGQKEAVFIREPKLRDAFLQVLFNHANSGGFDGMFTTGEKMNDLRGSLYEAAVAILGSSASDVLVIDIVRQDV